MAAIDAALGQEPTLDKAALLKRASELSARWADVYVQDMRASLGAMEGDARYFQDLNYRLAAQVIEQNALDEALRIHALEVQAGYYTVASEVAQRDVEAAERQQAGVLDASSVYEALFQDTEIADVFENPKFASEKRAKVATMQIYASYTSVHNQNKADGFLMWPGGVNPTGHAPVPYDPTSGTVAPDLMGTPAIVYELTRVAALSEIASAAASISSGRILARSGQESGLASVEGRKRQAKWALDDVEFRRLRSQAQIDARELRRLASEPLGGPMNIAEKCRALRQRFVEQMAETVARATVTASALRPIFGLAWDEQPPLPGEWDDTKGRYLDALQGWYVRLDSVLARAQQLEVAQVVIVSLKQTAGAAFKKAQDDLRSGRAKTFSVRWALNRVAIPTLSGPRLRGISVSTVESKPDATDNWSGSVTPPQSGLSFDSVGQSHLLNQPNGSIQAGRIACRAGSRPADVLGQVSAHGVTPLSDSSAPPSKSHWLLELAPSSMLGRHAYDLTDIVVEILVSGVTAP